jgi:imidazole glycerol-phosphate synthase subunit HisH
VIILIYIIDYGVGNLRSVEKAFHFIGADVEITNDPDKIVKGSKVVLPGVGAYSEAMKSLEETGMKDAVYEVIKMNKPFLGICLGLQLLFDYSEEGGYQVQGLGILNGEVKKFDENMNIKVPHMGWNKLIRSKESPLFYGLDGEQYVYFVHSFYLSASDREIVTAKADYGIEFDAVVNKGNIYATQFHPEKSGSVGLKMLENFINL